MVVRLYISRGVGAADDTARAPTHRISFLEAKRREALIRRVMRDAVGGNVLMFPVMRRCQGGPLQGPPNCTAGGTVT